MWSALLSIRWEAEEKQLPNPLNLTNKAISHLYEMCFPHQYFTGMFQLHCAEADTTQLLSHAPAAGELFVTSQL